MLQAIMRSWLVFLLGCSLGLLGGMVFTYEREKPAREEAFNMGIHLGLQKVRGYELEAPGFVRGAKEKRGR